MTRCQVPDCIDTTRGQSKGSSPEQTVQQIAEEKDCLNPHEEVLPLSVVDNSFSPHCLTILLDPVYSSF